MQNISFLIGAGFSCSAGFPTASELSNKIAEVIKRKLDNDPIRKFYNAYCKTNKAFNYESFYDWINGWGRLDDMCYKNINDDIFNHRFDEEFNAINNDINRNRLRTEAITELNKLVTFNLSDVAVRSSCYAAFADFISRLNSLGCTVDIYTLNHDLLMEELLNGRVDYSDGYSNGGENSIFYGFGCGKYKEASVFDGCFSSNTRLCKLHGSLDRYWIGKLVPYTNENGESLSVKVDRAYDVTPEFCQKMNNGGVKRFTTDIPDFLTGVETKKRYYRFSPYNTLFDNFKEYIKYTGALLIIGYSFCDEEVNEIIKQLPQSKPIIAACREGNVNVVKFFPNNPSHLYREFADLNYSELLSILGA